MAKQPEEQNIKSRARRRLIGAVALALAVVVVLPMVLDSEPKVTGQDIDLRIPASDKAGEFVPAASAVQQASVESVASQVGDTAVSGKIGKAEVVAETGAVELKNTETKPAEIKPVEVKKPEAKPAEVKPAEVKKPDAKPADVKSSDAKKQDAKPVDTRKADAKPEPKKPEAKPDDKVTYIVQVGAFSNAATAAQEADKLKGWGFKAYTEQIGSTTRVRVGPYYDRNKADEARGLLEKHGQHPVVTAVK